MSPIRTGLVAALALAAFLTTTTPCAAAPSATGGTVRVGDIAPDFILKTVAGKEMCLTNCLGKDKPILVVFWSYFCFPCQKEMPELEEIYRELGPNNLGVIGVSLDGPRFEGKVIPYLETNGITFPNVYDIETETFFQVAERYGVIGTPTSFLLDPQGRVRLIHLGRLDKEVLKKLVADAGNQTFCSEIVKPGPAPSE